MGSTFWIGAAFAAQDARAARLRRELRSIRGRAVKVPRAYDGWDDAITARTTALRVITSLLIIAAALVVVRGGR